jgi:hypothetical protein
MQIDAPATSGTLTFSWRKRIPVPMAKTVWRRANGATRAGEQRPINQNHSPKPITAPNRTV